ncbi:uncharacterized protein RBU47_013815 [Passerculus sandwichensis]
MEALRRPALPEDAVRSRLFAAAAGPGGEALLRRCAELALVRLAPLLAACVWQRQPFRLRYVPGRGEPGAGREARREERPELWDCEGEPAAGDREIVRGIRWQGTREPVRGPGGREPMACEGKAGAGGGVRRTRRPESRNVGGGTRERVRGTRGPETGGV